VKATVSAAKTTDANDTVRRESPYVGLVPYSEADAKFFFGREDDTDIIAANVKTSRLTLLYGASGVGKSSVLLAGVVPRLRELGRERLEGKPTFAVAVLRSWRRAPLANLIEAIRVAVADATGEDVAALTTSTLSETLHAWTERVRTILVVLDQFEDYFLYHGGEEGERTFVVEFPRIINDPGLRVNVLLSLREDAWAKLDRFEGQIPNLFGNYVRVEHLGWDAAGRAIRRPIDEYNDRLPTGEQKYAIEPALTDAVLNEVKTGRLAIGESGVALETVPAQLSSPQIETPFLQLVMERLWRATLVAGSYELRKQTLVDLGGAEKIVKTYLAESLHALDPEEQEIAAELFRYLITPSKTKIAHRTSDLAFWTERSEEELEPVLDKLSRAQGDRIRILRPIALPAGEEGSMYEIFHDVLAEPILEWRTYQEQEREKVQLAARVRAEEQQRERESRNRRVRRAAVVLLVLVAILATLAAIAYVQRQHASMERDVADSRALASDAFTQLGVDSAASVAETAKAIRIHPTAEAEGVLRAGLADSLLRAITGGHTGAVTSAAFSPDGRRVVTASADHLVRVWSSSGHPTVLRGHTAPVENVAFSPDGRHVIAGAEDGRALIWNAAGGQAIVLGGHSGEVVAAYSPDGKRAVTGGADGIVRIWNASTGDPVSALREHTGGITAVRFSPDGTRLLAASRDKTASIWRVSRPRAPLVLRGHTDELTAVAFSTNGDRCATASRDGTARIWNTANGSLIRILKQGVAGILDVAFSSDGGLVTASSDGSARIWSRRGGLRARLSHGATIAAAAFSPDGKFVLTAGVDGTARLWDASSGETVAVLRGHTAPLTSAAFSPDGSKIVTSSEDQTARIWVIPPPATGRLVAGSSGSSPIYAASFDADGNIVSVDASGSESTRSPSARNRATTSAVASYASAAAFSGDGKLAAIIGGDGRTHLWDVDGRHLLRSLPDTGPVVGAAFSADDKWVVTAGTDGVARVFDVETGRLRSKVRTPIGSVNAAAFSPDGKRLVTGGEGTTLIWDTSSDRRIASLPGHTGAVLAVGFSPDSHVVATGGLDGTARLWDAATWRPIAVLRDHAGAVLSVAFDPVGNVIATTGADGTARIWETSNGKELAVFRGHTKGVQTVGFSRDGTRVVTAGLDGTARIYVCDVCGSLQHLLYLARRVPSSG
jgi:WD40 repeat protein